MARELNMIAKTNSFPDRYATGKQRAVLLLVVVVYSVWLPGVLAAEPPINQHEATAFKLIQFRGGPSFDLRNAIIPVREIRSGGPPKDGIPALTNPPAISVQQAAYLKESDRVAGVVLGDEARAYPLKILNYHEIVNDHLGAVPIAVTYCPLCDSVVVFDRRAEGGEREFGVSGLLYNSNVLMYDRGGEPESLWSQVLAKGVSGPGAGQELKTLPVELVTWEDWRTRHPQTTVLSSQTGHARDYQTNPYRRYFAGRGLMFPVRRTSNALPQKSLVLGVWSNGEARAYPVSAFQGKDQKLEQELDGKQFAIVYDHETGSLRVQSAEAGIQWMYSFWFAWHAFRPHTEVFSSQVRR